MKITIRMMYEVPSTPEVGSHVQVADVRQASYWYKMEKKYNDTPHLYLYAGTLELYLQLAECLERAKR